MSAFRRGRGIGHARQSRDRESECQELYGPHFFGMSSFHPILLKLRMIADPGVEGADAADRRIERAEQFIGDAR